MKTKVIELNTEIALSAVEVSLRYSLPMADAIVYATGINTKCSVVTSDPHFKNFRWSNFHKVKKHRKN